MDADWGVMQSDRVDAFETYSNARREISKCLLIIISLKGRGEENFICLFKTFFKTLLETTWSLLSRKIYAVTFWKAERQLLRGGVCIAERNILSITEEQQ